MKRWLMIATVAVMQTADAEEVIVQFEQANQLYRSGEFQKAAEVYERIITQGYESPALYYNLGNAYFKLNNIPASILNYERAKRRAPHDEDILYNLHLAQLRVVDKIEPIPQFFFIEWWYAIINMNSSTEWAIILLACLWSAAGCGILFVLLRPPIIRRATLSLALVSMAICGVSLIGMVHRSQIEHNDQSAIIFSSSVSAKSAPDTQSTDLFILHEGVKVELLDSFSDWKKIRLADGKIAWVPLDALRVI